MPKPYCNISFDKTIARWDEAIPLGNGFMGALIWGPSDALRFSVDRTDIWDTTPPDGIHSPEFCYQNMVKLAREGNISEIDRIFDAPYNRPAPTKLPAGKIVIDTNCKETVVSGLDISKAQACIFLGKSVLKSFIHAEKKIGFIKLVSEQKAAFALENPAFRFREEADDVYEPEPDALSLKCLTYPEPVIHKENEAQWFVQTVSPDFSYGILLRIKQYENSCEAVYTVASSKDGARWFEEAMERLGNALSEGYESNFQQHCDWWKAYWKKSAVDLPDKLFEKNWYLSNYLFASCSRKGCYPMPLQGVWTADNGNLPPWKGDYHHDLNTQMSYYHYLKANHLEEGESFLDYLWSLRECAREFAKEFYHAEKGICLPSVMAIDGSALGGWGMYSLSPTNQLWLCQAFERHYRFTGDRAFLQERAYPYLKETAQFLLCILEEHDGRYFLPISSSPELHDNTIQAFVTPNSNYDLSLMRYLFISLTGMAEDLGLQEAAVWREVLQKLPKLALDKNDALMISPDESLNESQRHFAHLMAVHPLRLVQYRSEKEKRIIDASILDLERLGTGLWVGFSFTWMAELYAIQKNGNAAAYQLKTFWEHFCSPNGFNLNGDYKRLGLSFFHYRPFTLEANLCAADALQEMLMQTEEGIVELFPAIPEEWQKRKTGFTRLRAEQGLLVSAVMENGTVTSLSLEAPSSMAIRLRKAAWLKRLAAKYNWPEEEETYNISCAKRRIAFALCKDF